MSELVFVLCLLEDPVLHKSGHMCGACTPARMRKRYCSLPFPLVYMSACVWLFPANGTLTHDNDDLMLGDSRKRRANIKPTSGQHHIFTRLYRPAAQFLTGKI